MINNISTLKNPKSRAAEAYRTLRTNIQFSSLDNNLQTIVITSSMPFEGKSTVISNLATSIAQSGKKVLLIDCDLRRPTIHKIFDIPNDYGLTNILTQDKKSDECITASEMDNLYILTSGAIPPNPAELLASKKMISLIRDFELNFDMVLIDSPPVIVVTDAQVLSTIAQGVILVASYGETEKNALIKAKNLLKNVDAKILGVVINKVPAKYENYYYGKYYSNYY